MAVNRSSIAEQVARDFEQLRRSIDPNIPVDEAGEQWEIQLDEMVRTHVAGMQPDDARRYVAIYGEEYHIAASRRLEQTAQRRQLGQVAARTVVRATIWETIFALFR
jgi:hypothetical protein